MIRTSTRNFYKRAGEFCAMNSDFVTDVSMAMRGIGCYMTSLEVYHSFSQRFDVDFSKISLAS